MRIRKKPFSHAETYFNNLLGASVIPFRSSMRSDPTPGIFEVAVLNSKGEILHGFGMQVGDAKETAETLDAIRNLPTNEEG